ncbi:MAG: hypothetical protein ACKODS_07600 [Methylophilaceae bacterium]
MEVSIEEGFLAMPNFPDLIGKLSEEPNISLLVKQHTFINANTLSFGDFLGYF